MGKLMVTILLSVFIIGIAVYIFIGSNGVKSKVQDGHTSITQKVRTFDYVTN